MTLRNILAVTAILTLIAVSALYLSLYTFNAKGSAPSGLPAYFATSSAVTLVADVQHRIVEANRLCTSRIISTGYFPVMLAFEETVDTANNGVSSTTVSEVIGFWQAASTTVAYDSGQYGCGTITALSGDNVEMSVGEAR